MLVDIVFFVFALISIIATAGVVFLRHPLSSALSLVVSFFCVSILFVLLQATFLAVMQILIYAGAILVLFLYVLMLLNLEELEACGRRQQLFRSLVGFGFLVSILYAVFQFAVFPQVSPSTVSPSFGSISSVGQYLLGSEVVAYELISVLLLAGIVSVVMLSKGERQL